MMMRYVLCILALLLSCACVHVLAEEVPAADLSDQVPDTESETKILLTCPAAGAGDASAGGNLPCQKEQCDSPPGKGGEVICKPQAKAVQLPAEEAKGAPQPAAGGGRSGSDVTSVTLEDVLVTTQCATAKTEKERQNCDAQVKVENEEAAPAADLQGTITLGPSHQGGKKAETHDKTSHSTEASSSPGLQSSSLSEEQRKGSGTLSSRGSDERATEQDSTNNNDTRPTEESQVQEEGRQQGNTNEVQPPSSGPSTSSTNTPEKSSTQEQTSDTQGSQPNNGARDTNNSENTDSAAPNTPNNEESTSTTTTPTTTTTSTTTTLPPELTNNKKGDADSSSSISSSVWVRVPLLIVVTLACILVC
ncbi:uncharacterized protein TM35_001381010 [Trypanosoma theileri]|uniref:Mucin TcMUCII n=1 Tax=Trypanosoma theileri TaxID=67003 RepID=A0A1X0NFA7_9TRYP|nr:uncharacterized protein TM35_001381010 [Trypanosoma theileri]ORC80903.1 hypothetical protein TM35_001381010 [Trypanosoma theileri]